RQMCIRDRADNCGMRVFVSGLIGQYAFGGVTWDYVQYALGFEALGAEVWYLEDTGAWAYDPVKEEPSADCSANCAYLGRVMEAFGLGDRWLYRNGADGRWHGPGAAHAAELLAAADVLANVSGACWLTPETSRIPHKLFLDGDPMFTQAGMCHNEKSAAHVRAHDAHFSFGLNIGQPGCLVPECGLEWKPTVQPIALAHWPASRAAKDAPWTTVMNWSSYGGVELDGQSYGQKSEEFMKFVDLPAKVPVRFELAMGQGVGRQRPTELLRSKGWGIIEPSERLPDYLSYREFLAASRGEWSIAKHGYVQSLSGWFSCRSACYLALGRPVVVQDTGWTRHLPEGDGVLAFRSLDEAAEAIRRVEADYERHSQAARAYAEKYFDAKTVCSELLEAAGC
ncbi:MAG: hypothetical protein N2322_03720, partial [Terrimicrobiaceae bacterium]|nr:hypothetical protein [Terrimicrobiaceae bacterium]